MKNVYLINHQQKDYNILYTKFSGYCKTHCKVLIPLLEENLLKMEIAINFHKSWYNTLNQEEKTFYGDCIDTLLSGGSFNLVNQQRDRHHQPSLTPNQEMKEEIKYIQTELLNLLNHYHFNDLRWKMFTSPDRKYPSHFDLIANNIWGQDEAFDITVNKDDTLLMSKLIEIITYALNKKFSDVNVLNLYDGT